MMVQCLGVLGVVQPSVCLAVCTAQSISHNSPFAFPSITIVARRFACEELSATTFLLKPPTEGDRVVKAEATAKTESRQKNLIVPIILIGKKNSKRLLREATGKVVPCLSQATGMEQQEEDFAYQVRRIPIFAFSRRLLLDDRVQLTVW